MNSFKNRIAGLWREIESMDFADRDTRLPGGAWYLSDGAILNIPRADGDNKFPYGKDGYNFWVYASGYIHANEGLFSPFLRAFEGQEPGVAFFVRRADILKPLSLFTVPCIDDEGWGEVKRYTVFDNTCAYFLAECDTLRACVRICVNDGKETLFSVMLENRGCNGAYDLITFLNPFLAHGLAASGESRWFRKCEFCDNGNTDDSYFVFTINEDISRMLSVSNFGVVNMAVETETGAVVRSYEATTSRFDFVGGVLKSLDCAAALHNGHFEKKQYTTCFTDVAIAGGILHLDMEEGSAVCLNQDLKYLVYKRDDDEYRKLIGKIDTGKWDRFIGCGFEKSRRGAIVSFDGPSDVNIPSAKLFSSFIMSLETQVEFCGTISGYVQLSSNSLVGIRDVFQAVEGMLFFDEKKARAKMLEAFSFEDESGRFPRQYALPASENEMPAMDLRAFIDQGCWVIDAVATYLRKTGDYSLLKEKAGFYNVVDESRRMVKKSDKRTSVLDHMIRAVDYLIRDIDENTGCVKIMYGDWNDAIDGLGVSQDPAGAYGTGVSVMASLQLYKNISDMIGILGRSGTDDMTPCPECNKSAEYSEVRDRLEASILKNAIAEDCNGRKRVVHGWGDKRSYFVGSFADSDGESRVGVTSHAFLAISGILAKHFELKSVIIDNYKELESKYGYLTFSKPFLKGSENVGRIHKLPAGTAENGACYVHAAAFAVMSLFMTGESKAAWEQLFKLIPITHENTSVSPYVMPNSYGCNKELNIDGESMNDWQTGSSNVVYKTVVRFVIGFEPDFDGVWIQPAAWCPYRSFTAHVRYHGKKISIWYENRENGRRTFFVDNTEMHGERDDRMDLDRLWVARENVSDGMCIRVVD